MPAPTPLLNAYRLRLIACLVIFLTSIYMFTYSGAVDSNDTRTTFNATASLVQYGDLLLDKTAWYNRPSPLLPPETYPLSEFDAEPLQVTLPAPLFWLAEKLPGIGLVHAVWLFNVFVCTMLGVAIFCFALTLGYDERVAMCAALALGLTTVIWPYSRSFFREPLAALMILLTALFIERWRQTRYRSWWRLALVILAFAGAFLAKDAIILSIPALVFWILPSIRVSEKWLMRFHKSVRWLLVFIALVLALFWLASVLIPPSKWLDFYTTLAFAFKWNRGDISFVLIALHSYLFSIGGSVWATSPVCLLAIPGLWLLYRQHQYRHIFGVLALVAAFVVGYAVLRGQHWFGGLSWPERFLIPVVPFLVLAALPILSCLFERPARFWGFIIVLVLVYGLWIQINGVSLDWGAYNAALPPEAGGLGEWGGGLNDIRYLRWVLIPTLWGRFPFDFAWVRLNLSIWPILCVIIALVSAWLIWRWLTRPDWLPGRSVWLRWSPAYGLLLLPILIYLYLRAIYPDPLYLGDNPSLHNLVPLIQSNAQPGDVLLLADTIYEPFFLNYGDFTAPRVITLPNQPGERTYPDQTPQVVSANPDDLLIKDTIGFLNDLASTHDHFWLLADTGPWLPWSVRPIERFLDAHHYPIQEITTTPADPRIRLIEYSTVPAPDPAAFRQPDYLTDLRFGDSIHLVGLDLPSGLTYKPGATLPLSLNWQTDAPLKQDYTVAWFLADQSGATVTQGYDSPPDWGFTPTTTWQPGVAVWDNRALRLPADIKPGHYVLWIRLYYSDPAADLQLLPVTGTTVVQNTIGVLPVSIDIQS